MHPTITKRIIMKRLQLTVIALAAIVASAMGQALRVQFSNSDFIITGNNLTAMTALQFNLKLPEGVTIDTTNATLGSATDGHTLCIETLAGGDLLFILYSMDLNTFMDGELLRIPINGVQDGDASLYTIHYASADAVSHEAEDIVTGIASLTRRPSPEIYNVSGQHLNKMQQGINIVGGRKILK